MKQIKEKQFDCIKMKEMVQNQIYAETKNMSAEELLKYFNTLENDSIQLPEIAAENTPVYNCD